jgi:hypothetical protein
MARASAAEIAIPANGAESVPYPTHRELVGSLFLHGAEVFVGKVLGAGGAGGNVDVPFDPAIVLVSEATGSTLRMLMPGGVAEAEIDMVTGAAATGITVTTRDPGPPVVNANVALATALAPDGDTATVICIGARDVNGSA